MQLSAGYGIVPVVLYVQNNIYVDCKYYVDRAPSQVSRLADRISKIIILKPQIHLHLESCDGGHQCNSSPNIIYNFKNSTFHRHER